MDETKAASIIIYDSEFRVLLAKRSACKTLDPGLWETIGGTIEGSESSLEAIQREVNEELGDRVSLKDVEIFKQYRFNAQNKSLCTDVFTAQIEGTIHPSAVEIEEIKWFDKAGALELDFCMNCRQRVLDFYAEAS
jgi:8-oxo-dGTP diphosphatase